MTMYRIVRYNLVLVFVALQKKKVASSLYIYHSSKINLYEIKFFKHLFVKETSFKQKNRLKHTHIRVTIKLKK